jgi:hypothetical protein
MNDSKLIWLYRDVTGWPDKIKEGTQYIAQIINLIGYQTLYTFYLSVEQFEAFKNIMASDTHSIQYLQNDQDELSMAAKIKTKISPHKSIPYIKDPKVWQKENEYYI